MKNLLWLCSCSRPLPRKPVRLPTDPSLEATAGEIELIRGHLGEIERMLSVLFGEAYSREPQALKAQREAADLIDRHFDGIVDQWALATSCIFEHDAGFHKNFAPQLKSDLSNALLRFSNHLRDSGDLATYIHLRRHCQQGMLSRAAPSQFNVINIALKQVILDHLRCNLSGPRMEIMRAAVVAAVDERRLMVSQFYIESRERALRASEEKYRASIDHAPDPMYEIDAETEIIIGANAAAKHRAHRLLGGEEETSPVGLPLAVLIEPTMVAGAQHHLEAVVRNGSDRIYDLELEGGVFDIDSALIPHGNKSFIQMILHDVSQKREIMKELLRAERLAATGTFAAGVAHEVNNPLASISSLVQSLLPGEADTSRRMALHTVLSQVTRISGTLKDLVNFARPSPAQRARINLNELVDETLRLVGYNKCFNGINLEPQLAADLYPVFADKNEVQQVLLNLLLNAADAIQGSERWIHVVSENLPGLNGSPRVAIRVIDSGIGIPADNLERVFDPFFTTKPAGAGVGLGLSLCQRIALANAGAIKVESEVGKGTTVTVSLPAYAVDDHAEVAVAQ